VRTSLIGTVAFVVTAGLAAAVGRGPLRGLAAVVAVGLFVLGSLAYLAGYARAVQRSRTSVVDMAGLVFLARCAPSPVRRALLGATLVQVVAALVTASVRPFTTLAFGILAPVFGLGLQTLWAARHGEFPARPPSARRPGRARAPAAGSKQDDAKGAQPAPPGGAATGKGREGRAGRGRRPAAPPGRPPS
jgi:hypothetical protein